MNRKKRVYAIKNFLYADWLVDEMGGNLVDTVEYERAKDVRDYWERYLELEVDEKYWGEPTEKTLKSEADSIDKEWRKHADRPEWEE